MNKKAFWGLMACLVLPISTGCTAGPDVVRGQNPGDYNYAQQTQGNPQQATSRVQAMPVYFDGPASSSDPYMMHPQTQYGYGGGYGASSSQPSGLWSPQHRHTYDYDVPRRLVYPPANQPAAMVQYPYYTVKGPSDFFMK